MLRPIGYGAGDFVQIGDPPFRATDQGSALLNGGGISRTAGGLSCQSHAAMRLLPFQLSERHGFHDAKFYRNGIESQARWPARARRKRASVGVASLPLLCGKNGPKNPDPDKRSGNKGFVK